MTVCVSCLSICDVGVLWPNGWMDQDETWHGSRHSPSNPSPKNGGTAPPILAHVHCGQTVGWIKMKLGTEVGIAQAHIVLDGNPDPPP